jgi:DNA adenine methylase
MKPPLAYYGGKTSIAEKIVRLLPAHEHYVEPFAGSLAVLLAKPPSRMETVNDLDRDLMTFWKVLRDRPLELERAGTLRKTGWRYYVDPAGSSSSMPGYLSGYVERMAAVAGRLAMVSLECRPALEIIEAFGRHKKVLLYVDPPYLGSTGRSRNYKHEMSGDDEHRELAAALRACEASVVLSGYHSPLYDELYAGWHRVEIQTATGQAHQWSARTEVLWSNRPFPNVTPSLFDEEVAS